MHPVLKEALFANWETIVTNLPFEVILQRFMWAFSPDEYESVILASGETLRCEQLLLLISQKGDALFYELIKYLQYHENSNCKSPSEIVRSIVSHIEHAYEIGNLKNVKWHGLCAPNVRFVRALPECFDTDCLPSPFLLSVEPDLSLTDQSVDNLAQWSESLGWVLMKQSNTPCVVYHEVLTCDDDCDAFVFDLFSFISRKCRDLYAGCYPDSGVASYSVSNLCWLKSLSTTVKIVAVMGVKSCDNKVMQLMRSLHFAGVNIAFYSFSIRTESLHSDSGIGTQKFLIEESFYLYPDLTKGTDGTNEGFEMGAINYPEVFIGDSCSLVYEELPAKTKLFLKQSAILKDRMLYVKVMKCIWKQLCNNADENSVYLLELHQMLDNLIDTGILKHFLGSYFLSPSMKKFLMEEIDDNRSDSKMLHQNLLQAYLERYKTWSSIPLGDVYFQQYFLRHLIGAGGSGEALNLFTNLEWIMQRCGSAHSSKYFLFDLKYLISKRPEDRKPLKQLMNVIACSTSAQASQDDNKRMLLANLVSSFCDKINSTSVLSKLFQGLRTIVNNDEFWFLPLHNTIVSKSELATTAVNCLPINSRCLFCDLECLLFASEDSFFLVNRQTLQIQSVVKSLQPFSQAVVSHSKEREFNLLCFTNERFVINLDSQSITSLGYVHEGAEIITSSQVYEKFIILTCHSDCLLNIWCSLTFNLLASADVNSGSLDVDKPEAGRVVLSHSITEEDTLTLAVFVACGSLRPFAVVYEYEFDSLEITKMTRVALNEPVQFASLSTNSDLLVCFAESCAIDLYSIGSETYMRTAWNPTITSPDFFYRTKRGLFIFADGEGNMEVCSLEGQIQITSLWTGSVSCTAPVDHFLMGNDDNTLVAMSSREVRRCSFLKVSSVVNVHADGSEVRQTPPCKTLNAYLSSTGSLIYLLTEKRLVCESTDTLNPVQLFSLTKQVVQSCFVDTEDASWMFLYLSDQSYYVIKCPSFEMIIQSTDSRYLSQPLTCFFHKQLLFIVFDHVIEVWDCNLKKKVIINVGMELLVEDAYVNEDKLNLLLGNRAVKTIDLRDMTYDVTEQQIEDPFSSPLIIQTPNMSSNRFWAFQLQSSDLDIRDIFSEDGKACNLLLDLEPNIYSCSHVQSLTGSNVSLLLTDTVRGGIRLMVLKFNDLTSEFTVEASFPLEPEEVKDIKCDCSNSNVSVAPDASRLLWLTAKNQIIVVFLTQDSTKASGSKLKVFENGNQFTQVKFCSPSKLFACNRNGQFFIVDSDTMQIEQSELVTEFSLIQKLDLLIVDASTVIFTCDNNAYFLFWIFDHKCGQLKLLTKREHSSTVKSNSISFFSYAESTAWFLCLTEDEVALVWRIDLLAADVALHDQIEVPPAVFIVDFDPDKYSLDVLREDFTMYRNYLGSTDPLASVNEDSLRSLKSTSKFLGVSGLCVTVDRACKRLTVWDSLRQRLLQRHVTSSRKVNKFVDMQIVPDCCLIILGLTKCLQVWSYNEEFLLLDSEIEESPLEASSNRAVKLEAQLSLMFELTRIILNPNNLSLIALIDSRGCHHLVELFNKKFQEEQNCNSSFYFSKLLLPK